MNTKTRRIAKIIVLLFAVTAAGMAKAYQDEIKAYVKSLVPIRHVRIEGRFRYLGHDEVKNALLPLVKIDFFSADMQAIHRAAEAIPWVEKAEVKRVWPDAVDIRIEEQAPVMRWGSKSLLNARGEPFSPVITGELQRLPLITGPQGYERRLLEIMLGLQQALAAQELELTAFYVTERRSWKLRLSDGLEIELGRQKPLKNFQRLLKVLPILGKEKIAAVAKIDMRYPNGFTVVWKPDTEITWPKNNAVKKNTGAKKK
ncbi:MAG: cell division protein FtsQ/DivIB [Gammaproteobacteria bacterium]